MKKILIGICVVLLIAGIVYFKMVKDYKDKVKKLEIKNVDLSNVKDGEYIGECDLGLVYVKAKVVIKDNKYKKITLIEHKNGKGQPAEVLTDKIVDKQSVEIDTVSGATASSKAILSAVSKAVS